MPRWCVAGKGNWSLVSVGDLDLADDSRLVLFISFLLLSLQQQRYHYVDGD